MSDSPPKLPTNRSFGLTFTAFFALVALWPLVKGETIRWWALAATGVFIAVTFLIPVLLTPLNRLWMKFGAVMHKVVSPVALGIVFFGAIAPMGIIMRACGKDFLRLRKEPGANTYWIAREPSQPDHFTRPF